MQQSILPEKDSMDQLLDKMAQAKIAQKKWQHTSVHDRSTMIMQWMDSIKAKKNDCAHLLTIEGNKPINQSVAEVEKCLLAMQWFCQQAPSFPWIQKQESNTEIRQTPLGNILHIMPFNFPFWQLIRAAVPTLLSGNAVLIKPSRHAVKTTELCLKLAKNLPESLIQICHAQETDIPEMIAHKDIHGVTFTGSNRVACIIGEICGRNLKPYIAEGAGQDPYLILPDCDITSAIQQIAASRLRHSGQACNAAKRMIVAAEIHDAFVNALTAEVRKVQIGDPLLPETQVGPLVSEEAAIKIQQQINDSVNRGAHIAYQSRLPDLVGPYCPITILTHVPPNCPAYTQELFGPVFSIIKAQDTEEMIHIANDSEYGLCAGVFTQNHALARKIMPELQAGQVVLNQCFSSSWSLPFTGIKKSGLGSECSKIAFTNFTFPKLYKY